MDKITRRYRDKITRRYRDILLDVINQSCQVDCIDGECYVAHDFISSYEEAFFFLEEQGLLEECGYRYKILWPGEK